MTRTRVNLSIDPETLDVLRKVSEVAEMSVAGIVSTLLHSHLTDLCEYLAWMEQLEPDSRLHAFGKTFIKSHGPTTLVQDIKKIDPSYQTEGEKFTASIKEKAE